MAEYIARTLARFDIEVAGHPVSDQYDYWSNRIYQTDTSVMLGGYPDYPGLLPFPHPPGRAQRLLQRIRLRPPRPERRIGTLPSSKTMDETRTLAEINAAFENDSLYIPLYYISNFIAIRSRVQSVAFKYGEIRRFRRPGGSAMNQSLNRIKDSLLAGQPIVQVISFEEKRVEGFLRKLCQQTLKNQNVYTWDSHNGLSRGEAPSTPSADSLDPSRALDLALEVNEPAFFVFRDLTPLLRDNPGLIRQVRECYLQFKGSRKFLFLLSPDDYLPASLKKEIDIIQFELPDYEELESLCGKFLESWPRRASRSSSATRRKGTSSPPCRG